MFMGLIREPIQIEKVLTLIKHIYLFTSDEKQVKFC